MLEPSAPLAKTKTPPKRFCSSTEIFSLDGLRVAFSEAFKKDPNNKIKKNKPLTKTLFISQSPQQIL
uniref:Uncharacterized protein n=1 Tax=Helicobacter pylori TaxID=210 RepID=A0A7G1HPM2_HELPX|nr:hypothetical protein HPKE_04890 [Helicobacter pylori]